MDATEVKDALDADSDDSEGEFADPAWLLADNDHPPDTTRHTQSYSSV